MEEQKRIQLGLKINLILSIISILLCIGFYVKGLAPQGDLTNFYTGWVMAKEGLGSQLYDLEVQAEVQHRILGFSFENGILPYSNPPHAVFPFLPLAWLPFKLVVPVWVIINLVILIAILRHVLNTIAANWSANERRAIVLITIAFTPLQITFMLGTFSLIIAASLTAAMIAFQRGQDIRGVLWLVVATIKFPLIILPALALLGGMRWKAIIAGLIATIGIAITTCLAFGWSIWNDYVSFLSFHNDSYNRFGIKPLAMDNLKGLLSNLIGMQNSQIIATVTTISFLFGAIVAILLMIKKWNPKIIDWHIRYSIIIAMGLFFNLHLYTHDLTVLLVAILMSYNGIRNSSDKELINKFSGFVLLLPLLIFITDWLLFSILPIGNILLLLGFIGFTGFALRKNKTIQQAIPETSSQQR